MTDESLTREEVEPPPTADTESRYGDKYVPALIRDRVAALFIDFLLLAIIGVVVANVMTVVTHATWKGWATLTSFHWQLLAAIMALVGFLYFFILEGALGATVGKLLCRLRMATKRGDYPSLLAIAVRNLLRPVELIVAPLITIPVMEWTHYRQRPSDLLFGTLVVQKLQEETDDTPRDLTFASATGRLIVSSIGALFLGALGGAALLNATPERWLVSVILLNTLPAAIILYKILLNTLCQSEVVGWFFGHKLASENGTPLTFGGSILRALAFPLDLVGGYPAMLLSTRRQRLGDFLSGTAVIRGRAAWYRGVVPLVLTIVLTGALSFTGWTTRGNFLKAPLEINVLNKITLAFPDPAVVVKLKRLLKS